MSKQIRPVLCVGNSHFFLLLFQLVYQLEDFALETGDEEDRAKSPTQEIVAFDTESFVDFSELPFSLSGDQEEHDRSDHVQPEQKGGLGEERKSGEDDEPSKQGVGSD